jgi:hypothetical protein
MTGTPLSSSGHRRPATRLPTRSRVSSALPSLIPTTPSSAFPEYHSGLGSSAVHEESSHLAKDVNRRLVHQGANLVLPKVGHNEKSIAGIMRALEGLGYTVDLVHVGGDGRFSLSATSSVSSMTDALFRRNILPK